MSRSNKRTAEFLFKKAEHAKKLLESGKLSRTDSKRVRTAYHNYRKRAKRRAAETSLVKPDQHILPGFLGQMTLVKLEEIIAERVLKNVAKKLGVNVEEINKVVG